MNEPNPTTIVLTPEQRSALGKVYQLILSWRRQRLQREGKKSTEEIDAPVLTVTPVLDVSESEA
ncbi:MAG TPA: hypothetical protein PKC99_00655 [Anaerolineales bacterium]|nr:hypothetical protein [Anaerolineales bacterium]